MKSTKGQSSNKTEAKKNDSQRSLAYRVIECQMRKDHDQYQQLLITQKQLELALLEEQSKNKAVLKMFEKQKKVLDNLNSQLKRIQFENLKQQTFLKQYYKFLESKLKTGTKPIILYAGLEQINGDLQEKLLKQQKNLEEGMQALKTQTVNLAQELQKLEHKKQVLQQELQITKIEKQAERSQYNREKANRKKIKEQYEQALNFYQQSIQQFKEEKIKLQKKQKNLKKIRDIENYHKKYWLSIQNAIKKQFSYQVRSKHYKETVAEEYRLKLPDLQMTLNNKKYENEVLASEIEQRKKKLQEIKENLKNSNARISRVSSQKVNQMSGK